MKSARAVIALPGRRGRSAEELAFLPAALEVVETPPSPLAGAIGGTIIALFIIALVWACFGQVDIVASATGKIIPTGRTKTIQPFETGIVRQILVRDGQSVKAGDVLIDLDQTINEAERQRIKNDLVTAKLDVARITAALGDAPDPVAAFAPPEDASGAQVAMQRRLLVQQVEEHRSKLASFDHQKSQKEAELATVKATVNRLQTVLPVLQQRVDIRKILLDKEIGSKANYLEILQALVEIEQEVLVQRSKSREVESALVAATEAKLQSEAEYRRNLFSDVVEAQRKVASLTEELTKATRRTELQRLTAPVDGTVQQVAVHTVGGVVTPAQALMMVVPVDSHLEIDAMISNRDIGFIRPGQDVSIKVDTFSFTKYGLLHGRVLSVSQDAITRDNPQDRSGNQVQGAENATSEPKGQELVYAARISLDRTQMQVDENLVNLSPGMAVTVEIRTGERRVIDYLLSPLLRHRQESLRER